MSWCRRLLSRIRPGRRSVPPSPELREAQRARERAEHRLGAVKDETPAILGAADQLIRLGAENDFATRLRNALGGPGD